MIFASFLLFALTMLVIFYPLVRTKSQQQEISLLDIYKKNYLATEQRLNKALQAGTLTQAQYDAQTADAARDLLKMDRQNRAILSKPARLIVVLIALLFPVLAIGGFWAYSYTPATRLYDSERARLMDSFAEWRDTLPESELDSLNNVLTIEPQPRDPEIFNELKYGFPALFYMSAKETHSNPQTLKLLGKILYDVKWYPAAHEVYSRVAELLPTDYISHAMLLDMEMQNAKGKITPAIEARANRLFALYPNETSLRVMYAQALYDNQMIDQSIQQWQTLRNIFASNNDPSKQAQVQQTLQAIDMILASIEQRTMETAQVRNYIFDIATFSALDWNALSDPAILTLYMVDLEDNTSIAYKELIITENTTFPTQLAINDFDRFNTVNDPIRNYEHLAIFGEITNAKDGAVLYATDLVELPKGAYEGALTFDPVADVKPFTQVMTQTVEQAKAIQNNRFLVQVNVPNVDFSALPEDATLNLFISPKGSRMPLAAKKIPSAKHLTFPITVEITDADRLMEASPSLFSLENLEVGGRLSMTTEVVGTAGDIESAKQTISPDKLNVLIFDQIREESKTSPMAPR